MAEALTKNCRYFLTYTGTKLPLTLLEEIDEAGLKNRNTYFCGYFDGQDRLVGIQKIVYGELEMEHRYYYDGATLKRAEVIDIDGDITEITC
jgi:hypothetical protein